MKDELTTDKTMLFSFDELTDLKVSEPAEITGLKIPEGTTGYDWVAGMDKPTLGLLLTENLFSIDIDDSGIPVTINLNRLNQYMTNSGKITGDLVAEEITNQLIKGFG